MGPVAKRRISQAFGVCRHIFRWGWIPLILTLGFKRGADPGMPEPTILSLFWG